MEKAAVTSGIAQEYYFVFSVGKLKIMGLAPLIT
jgi:hypothetical protein